LLDRFRHAVLALDPLTPLTASSESALTIHHASPLTVVYAPFEYTPATARIVLVGITPGHSQASTALKALHFALKGGKSDAEALRIAKMTASFAGQMRNNLVKSLDLIGLNSALGLTTCAELFGTHELAHFTSALRYPVFKAGENYNGAPDILRTPMLKAMVDIYLVEEARSLPDALWLPLGPKPVAALQHLVARKVLPAERLLIGLPHPSPANGGPIKQFREGDTSTPYGRAREAMRTRLCSVSL